MIPTTNQRIIKVALLLLLTTLLGCASELHKTELSSPHSTTLTAIHQYVQIHKGWSKKKYHVERHANEGRYEVYYVLWNEDLKPRYVYRDGQRLQVTGGGESFVVYYDPVAGAIVRELYFQ